MLAELLYLAKFSCEFTDLKYPRLPLVPVPERWPVIGSSGCPGAPSAAPSRVKVVLQHMALPAFHFCHKKNESNYIFFYP